MSNELDKFVEKRWGSWDKMYAAVGIDDLLEEIFELTQYAEKHKHDFDDGFNYANQKNRERGGLDGHGPGYD